jgi:hypothetical protein
MKQASDLSTDQGGGELRVCLRSHASGAPNLQVKGLSSRDRII